MIEDRLTEVISDNNIDICKKCVYFTRDNDPLDQTNSCGNCSYHNDFCFTFNYCDHFKSKIDLNNFIKNDKNQTYNIALITSDKKYFYFKGLKPISYNTVEYSDGIELVFSIPEINIYQLPITRTFIDNKEKNNCSYIDYIVSKEDNEKELKELLIKSCLHEIDIYLGELEKEKEKYRNNYIKLSKYLIN